eukprot:scaffold1039_cov101-Cylindrotheca_fusiformis.AAC.4
MSANCLISNYWGVYNQVPGMMVLASETLQYCFSTWFRPFVSSSTPYYFSCPALNNRHSNYKDSSDRTAMSWVPALA